MTNVECGMWNAGPFFILYSSFPNLRSLFLILHSPLTFNLGHEESDNLFHEGQAVGQHRLGQ